MPLTVDAFLEQAPELITLRKELTLIGRGRRGDRTRRDLACQEASLRQLWARGLVGSLTEAEGRTLAGELTAEARAAGVAATASVMVDDSGAWIVFDGSLSPRSSTHRLLLSCSNPIRVRAHWEGFVPACARLPT